MGELSADLQSFLAECEEAFGSRYTEDDSEFSRHCEEKPRNVPIEDRWFVRPPRAQFDRTEGSGGRGRRGHWEERGPPRDSRDYRGDQRRGDYREDHRGDYRADFRGNHRGGDFRGNHRGDYRGGDHRDGGREFHGERDNRGWRQRDSYPEQRPHPYERQQQQRHHDRY